LYIYIKQKYQDERRSDKNPDRIGKPGHDRYNRKDQNKANHPGSMKKHGTFRWMGSCLAIVPVIIHRTLRYDIGRAPGKENRHEKAQLPIMVCAMISLVGAAERPKQRGLILRDEGFRLFSL
jgi:hypothetical protein